MQPNRDQEQTPLLIASARGDVDQVEALLANGASPHVKSSQGDTPIHVASHLGHAQVVHVLLEAGADPNTVVWDDGTPPLYFAAAKGHLRVVELLLEADADPNIRGNVRVSNSFTPLHVAAYNGHVRIVQLLLEAGAIPDAKGNGPPGTEFYFENDVVPGALAQYRYNLTESHKYKSILRHLAASSFNRNNE